MDLPPADWKEPRPIPSFVKSSHSCLEPSYCIAWTKRTYHNTPTVMIFQRRFHSHTPTTIDSPPTPPPKDGPKTLEEILAITVSPRAPKPPPHAPGTVASNSRIFKNTPLRSASSPLKSTLPRRAPSSRKTGHATIQTDAVDGHEAFESDAFAVHMPTTRIPIIDTPVSRPKAASPAAQAEAVETYKEKAKQARARNNSVGVRVPHNIASYDYAYASSSRNEPPIPAVLKPSSSPPAPAGAFPVSPPASQETWTQTPPKRDPVIKKRNISSNTSVYRKPTVLAVTTAATVIKESVQYVRPDANGGASRSITPPKSTTVKISMKPRTPVVPKAATSSAIKTEVCEAGSCQAHTCTVEHCRGIYYRPAHMKTIATSRSPSPTKTMPNFARQYSVEGDSIFGYKVKDPLGTVAGADKSASSSSEDEKPSATTNKTDDATRRLPSKRTLTNRWPWIKRGGATNIGIPPSAPAPDPPIKAPVSRRPVSVYVSPFDGTASPPSSLPPVKPVPLRAATAAAAKTTTAATSNDRTASPKWIPAEQRTSAASSSPAIVTAFDTGFAQVQALFLLALKTLLFLYIVVAVWFVLDAVREALFVVFVPLRIVIGLALAVMSLFGRALGGVAKGMGGRVRVLGR